MPMMLIPHLALEEEKTVSMNLIKESILALNLGAELNSGSSQKNPQEMEEAADQSPASFSWELGIDNLIAQHQD